MKLKIIKLDTIDCTSDPMPLPFVSLKDTINTIKFVLLKTNLVRKISSCDVKIDGKNLEIVGDRKEICRFLEWLLYKDFDEICVFIYVNEWYFGKGGGCSDYIYFDYRGNGDAEFIFSIQDWYGFLDKFKNRVNKELKKVRHIAVTENGLGHLHLHITDKCNANCKTCYKSLDNYELKKRDWKKIPKSKAYAIGGGEPLLYKHIDELVGFLKKRNAFVEITTNGSIRKRFKNKPDMIAISIDGLEQSEHKITHNTDLNYALGSIDFYKKQGIEVVVNHIVHRRNIEKVDDFINHMIKKYGVKVNLILFKGSDKLKPTYEQLENFGENIKKYADNVLLDSCFSEILNVVKGYHFSNCVQGTYSKYYFNGKMFPCSHSRKPSPRCSVREDYVRFFFETCRPAVLIYYEDGLSGSHRFAYKYGMKGKIIHKITKPLLKKMIYILTHEQAENIEETHYRFYLDDGVVQNVFKRGG